VQYLDTRILLCSLRYQRFGRYWVRYVKPGAAGRHQQVALRANSANQHKHAQTLRKRFRVCALYAQTRAQTRALYAQTCIQNIVIII
jgi:hypothetical protein